MAYPELEGADLANWMSQTASKGPCGWVSELR